MRPKSPWAVVCNGDAAEPCNGGELIYLTAKEYEAALSRPNQTWRCPYCKCEATWDDANYEAHYV